MLKIHRWFILVGVIFIVFIFLSIDFNSTRVDGSFNKWVRDFSKNLDRNLVSQEVIDNFQQTVKLNENLIDQTKNNANSTLSIYQSINNKITESTILYSQVAYKDNKEILENLEATYKVPSSLILSVVAIGSNFGADMGGHKVIDTLATLAFTNQDSPKYSNELAIFLQLVTLNYIDINIFGKDSGTFSQLNILPSTYFNKGVDASQDGKIDLINSNEDIFATSANLLTTTSWENGNTWGNQIIVPNTLDLQTQQGVTNARALNDWKSLGLVNQNGEMLPMIKSNATLILFDNKRSGVLLYDNFNIIYNINNTLLDALAIGILSDKINDYINLSNYGKKVTPKAKPKLVLPKTKHENITINDKYKDIIK